METFPPSQLPPRGSGPIPILLSLFFLFSFAMEIKGPAEVSIETVDLCCLWEF